MIKQTIINSLVVIGLIFTNSASIIAEQIDTTVIIPPLVISEVQNNGELDNTSTQEFIEIYNPGTQPINLLDWQVVYRNSSGNESVLYVFNEPRLVLPGEFIIGKHNATAATYLPDILADFTYATGSTGLAQTSGGVVLKDNTLAVIDEVRWTKATTYVNDITIGGLLGGMSIQRTCTSDGVIKYSGIQINDYIVGNMTPRLIACDEPIVEDPPIEVVNLEVVLPPQDVPDDETDVQPETDTPNQTAQLPIYFNELFMDPVSPLTDANDEYVELYNPHAEAINIGGYSIVAGITTKYRYTFAAGTVIAPSSFITVTSGDTPLTLSNSSGQAVLFDTTGMQVDSVEYAESIPGQSWALNPTGSWEWTSSPTFNSVNIITVPVVLQKAAVATKTTTAVKKSKTTTSSTSKKTNFSVALPIQLNEIYPDPKSPQTDANDEYIELYNPYPYAINITDYTVVAGTTKTTKYVLPKGSIIAANGYFVITSADTSLSLTNTSGQVRLLNNFDKQIDSILYDKAISGASWARDDYGKWQWTDVVTKGAKNSIVLASSTSSSKQKSSSTTVAGATVAGTEDTPLVPAPQPLPSWVLALIGVSAVCYAAYEYRFEARNYIYKFRANRTAG